MKPRKTKPRRGSDAGASEDNVVTTKETNVVQNSTTVIDLRQFIEAKGGKPFTTSLNVAKAFDKQHHHVMQKLDAMDCSEPFLTSNFSRVQFEHRGNQYDACEMTKDGFMFLVMGFTGKKAAAVKEAYISAFNWMAEQLGSSGSEQVDSILRSTIGTDGFHMLSALIKGKVSCLPAAVQRRATAKLWSQTHAAFGVRSAADIPADELDAARNFIAAYAIEGEWLGKAGAFADILGRPMKPAERWMVYTDRAGNEQYKPIPYDACVLTHRELIAGMLSDIPVSTGEMFEFAMAALANLKGRHDSQAERVKAGRIAA